MRNFSEGQILRDYVVGQENRGGFRKKAEQRIAQ